MKINDETIVVEKIDSIKIKVNNTDWGTYSSESIDTAGLNTWTENNYRVTNESVKYQVFAEYNLEVNAMETAGDYVNCLSSRMVLDPGGYLCEIR